MERNLLASQIRKTHSGDPIAAITVIASVWGGKRHEIIRTLCGTTRGIAAAQRRIMGGHMHIYIYIADIPLHKIACIIIIIWTF